MPPETTMLHGLNAVALNHRPGDWEFLLNSPATPLTGSPGEHSAKTRKRGQRTRAEQMNASVATYLSACEPGPVTRHQICERIDRSLATVIERMETLAKIGYVAITYKRGVRHRIAEYELTATGREVLDSHGD